MNTADGKAYMKKDVSGTETIVEIGAGAAGVAGDVVTTAKAIATDYTLASDRHMLSIHAVEVEDGVTVEVPDECVWIVID